MSESVIHQNKALVLTSAEYATLYNTGTLIKDGVTYTYSPNVEYRVKGHYYTSDEVDTLLSAKQGVLTAGDNISISSNIISAGIEVIEI